MERAALLSRGELILPEHLPARIRPAAGPSVKVDEADARHLEEIEYQAVLQTLRGQDFNRTATAKLLGISRRALIYKLQRMRERGLDVDRASN
jgi:DNA-binding NtrC family response regulator